MTNDFKLSWNDAAVRAKQGQALEQWLGVREQDGFRFIRWIRIERLRSGRWAIWDQECLDAGSEDEVDVSEFPGLDPDQPEGKKTEFATSDETLSFACEDCGAARDAFLASGDIQAVYKKFVQANGKALKGINEWYE